MCLCVWRCDTETVGMCDVIVVIQGGLPPSLLSPLGACGAHFAAHLGAVNKFMVYRGNYVQAFYIRPNGCRPWLIHQVAEGFTLLTCHNTLKYSSANKDGRDLTALLFVKPKLVLTPFKKHHSDFCHWGTLPQPGLSLWQYFLIHILNRQHINTSLFTMFVWNKPVNTWTEKQEEVGWKQTETVKNNQMYRIRLIRKEWVIYGYFETTMSRALKPSIRGKTLTSIIKYVFKQLLKNWDR